MIDKNAIRYKKPVPANYPKIRLIQDLNYETMAKERFELIRSNIKLRK